MALIMWAGVADIVIIAVVCLYGETAPWRRGDD